MRLDDQGGPASSLREITSARAICALEVHPEQRGRRDPTAHRSTLGA
jgi:hypothetical protein